MSGRICNPIFQYLLPRRNSSSSASFGLTSNSGGEAPLGEDQHSNWRRGRRAVCTELEWRRGVHRQRMTETAPWEKRPAGRLDSRELSVMSACTKLAVVKLHALSSDLGGGSRDGGGREVDADHGA